MSEITTISHHKLIGDELLVGIFNEFPVNKPFTMKGNIHELLADARENHRFKDLLTNYSFDPNGQMVWSPEICDAMTNLQLCRLITCYKSSYYITEGMRIRFEKFIQLKLTEQQCHELQTMAKLIKDIIII